ncbi:MAG: heavy metal translocating P-type ATPase metal-binding domain-containing protein [Opitutales bacterium]|nr:heavy metal translocating P-type ATPase metal-binding domain-containing protein [Opitutales bacterium]
MSSPLSSIKRQTLSSAPGNRACAHCGLPFQPRQESDRFCCHGCHFVHGLLHHQGLERFYELREGSGQPVAPHVFHPRDFSWLEDLVQEAEEKSDRPVLSLDLQGITCLGCVWLLERLFQRHSGALKIDIQAVLGRVRIRWKKGAFNAAEWASECQKFGYLLAPESDKTNRGHLAVTRRMGVSAALAMNCMLFTVPHYFGMEEDFLYAPLFTGLTVLFATLSFLVGGTYFFQRTWQGLRMGQIHIDLPISLGLFFAYAGSLYGWTQGHLSLLYFDFVAVFVFLMLLGRWTQELALEKNRNFLLRQRNENQRLEPPPTEGGKPFPSSEVKKGMRFLLKPGQYCPVRAEPSLSEAAFSMDWITGEPESRVFPQGREVPAGALLAGREPIVMNALEGWADSHLHRLFQIDVRESSHNPVLQKVISIYLVLILLIAMGGFAGWFFLAGEPIQAFQVMISVLVVSCPCAIGVAWPLLDEVFAAALRKRGLFLKESNFWVRLDRVRKVLLDKTGTLTRENLVLENPGELDRLMPREKQILWSLVDQSSHPVARCLREEFLAREPYLTGQNLRQIREYPGKGVETTGADGGLYRLGHPDWAVSDAEESSDSKDRGTVLSRDRKTVAKFHLREELREGVLETIAEWQREVGPVYLLSGDQPAKVAKLAQQIGVDPSRIFARQSPEDKARLTAELDQRDTLLIGDGANDSLAFDQAFLSGTPAVDRGLLENKADFYFLGQSVNALRELFALGRRRKRVLRQVFTFTICYNAMAITLCLYGLMNPLLAAIIMPLSSLISIGSVWFRRPRTSHLNFFKIYGTDP